MTVIYVIAQFMSCSWFYGVLPPWLASSADWLITLTRLMLLLVLIGIAIRGVRTTGREGWCTLPAIVFIAVGLFAQELSTLHVPGIWFPFGTGVSRTQYAYVAFDVVFAALLLRRLARFARERRDQHGAEVAP